MIEDKSLLLNDLITEYINNSANNSRTRETYKSNLNAFMTWLVRHSNVQDVHKIEATNIREFQAYLIGKGYSDYTIASYLITIKSFYRYLYETGAEKKDFLKGFKMSVKKKYFRKKPLSEEQMNQLLNSVDRSTTLGSRDFAILNLLCRMGLRCREVTFLDKDDFTDDVVTIRRKGSNFKDDRQGITASVLNPIKDYWMKASVESGSPAFLNHSYNHRDDSRRLNPKTINIIVKRYLKKIGIDDPMITAHSLRHSCAIILLRHKVDLYDIKTLLCHKSIATTQRYVIWAEEDLKKEARALNQMDRILDPLKNKINPEQFKA